MAFFLAKHPLFGTKNNRKSLGYQERSPYYWWWAYLRRNKDYLACCESGGVGNLASLYEAFGDVREDDFHKWWMVDYRGAKLFREEQAVTKLCEISKKDEWSDDWAKEDVMVIAVPLTESKRDLQKYFTQLLKKRHGGVRGRIEKPYSRSTAKYKLSRNFTIASLKKSLEIYDYYQAELAKGRNIKLWEVGAEKKLMPSMKFLESDTRKDISYKRNVLAAAVKRYLNQAEKSIANTSLGVFP